MNIVYIEYSIATSSIDIFCSGCNPPYCKDCFNLELIDFNKGELFSDKHLSQVEFYFKNFSSLIERVFLVGGSWDMQVDYLEPLTNISKLCKKYNKYLYLFTRNNIENVPTPFKNYCDYIKVGQYIKELTTDNNIVYGIKLATSNQTILKKDIDY